MAYSKDDAYWKMVDDEGLFQGGKRGRAFGRIRDWWEDNTADPLNNRTRRAQDQLGSALNLSDRPTTLPGLSAIDQNKQINIYNQRGGPQTPLLGPDAPVGPEREITREMAEARTYAASDDVFDPSNPVSVRNLQKKLNLAGYTDEEGNPLKEDAMFGPKTESALRKMQSEMPQSNQQQTSAQRFGFKDTPEAPSQLSTPDDEIAPNNQLSTGDEGPFAWAGDYSGKLGSIYGKMGLAGLEENYGPPGSQEEIEFYGNTIKDYLTPILGMAQKTGGRGLPTNMKRLISGIPELANNPELAQILENPEEAAHLIQQLGEELPYGSFMGVPLNERSFEGIKRGIEAIERNTAYPARNR